MTTQQKPDRASPYQHPSAFAVRSFAIGNPRQAVFGLLMGNP